MYEGCDYIHVNMQMDEHAEIDLSIKVSESISNLSPGEDFTRARMHSPGERYFQASFKDRKKETILVLSCC